MLLAGARRWATGIVMPESFDVAGIFVIHSTAPAMKGSRKLAPDCSKPRPSAFAAFEARLPGFSSPSSQTSTTLPMVAMKSS